MTTKSAPRLDDDDAPDSSGDGPDSTRDYDRTSARRTPAGLPPAVIPSVRPSARDLDDHWIGHTIGGRFTVIGRLGMGSMGAVYRATQNAMAREVAIKILRPERSLDDQAKARFLREARTTSLLTSPHTVTVFDFGESDDGELYLAMELLQGESLGQRLTRLQRLPYREAVEATRQALRSLSEAHGKGIVHRDLKPDNLFFAQLHAQGEDSSEILKVLDFGIAKMLHGENKNALNAVETQAGTVFGTPRYMSPEQAQGKTLDARSDLYSLGVILYHMLTGDPPFTDEDAIMVMARHIKTQPKPPSEVAPDARIPASIEQVVLRTLSKEAALRPATADELSQLLQRALEEADTAVNTAAPVVSAPQTAPSRRAWLWIAGGAIVGLGAVSVLWRALPREPKVVTEPAASVVEPVASIPEPEPVIHLDAEPPAAGAPSAATSSAAPPDDDEPTPTTSAGGRPNRRWGVGKPATSGKEPATTPPPAASKSYGIFEN